MFGYGESCHEGNVLRPGGVAARGAAALSAVLQTYWTDFAKTGDPNGPELPAWPSWSDDKMEFLEIGKDAGISTERNFSPPLTHLSASELKESFKGAAP